TDGGIVLHLHRRLRILVLVSANASTTRRLDRPSTHWLGRGYPIRPWTDRNVAGRLELRSSARAAVAFCRPPTHCCSCPGGVVLSSPFRHLTRARLLAGWIRHDRLFAFLLGVALFSPFRFRRSGSSWLHQLHRQPRWLCWT